MGLVVLMKSSKLGTLFNKGGVFNLFTKGVV